VAERIESLNPRLRSPGLRDLAAQPHLLSINTATVRAQGNLEAIFHACVEQGISAVSPWRDQVKEIGLTRAAALVASLGLRLSGYCRGGMFTAADAAGLQAAHDDNRRAVDEACEMGAPCLVLVVGGLPGALEGRPAHRDIAASRLQVTEGIHALLGYASSMGMPLAIEPLHPMYAADRACINTLEQALDVCELLDPSGQWLGVAVDAYHVWWDPGVHQQIARAGAARIKAFHVCDWLVPTTDLLLDRGMMGDGVIELQALRASVEAAGYQGMVEVEIFSQSNWWKRPMQEVLHTCLERFKTVV
jgi:sugar phosphate isomerase/epimerase